VTGNHENRHEPTLAIDFGTSYCAAYLVLPGRNPEQVIEPGHGARWASAALAIDGTLLMGNTAKERKADAPEDAFRGEFKRDLGPGAAPISLGGTPYRPERLMLEMIRAIASEAQKQLTKFSPGATLGRTVLTVPAFYEKDRPLRELMFSVLDEVVDGPVQLLPEPVAAAWGLREELDRAQRELILVYDFGGGTFDAALVEIGPGDDWRVLGLDSERVGGKDIDVDLARLLRRQAGGWLAHRLEQVTERQAEILRYRFEAAASAEAEQLKVQLSRVKARSVRLLDAPDPVRVTEEQLNELARPHIMATIQCCRRLLTAQGKTPADLSAVLLVGGSTLMPLVTTMLRGDLLPEVPPERRERFQIGHLGLKPELAVAYGAARWAVGNPVRAITPVSAPAGGSVLRWRLDDPERHGGKPPRLMRWHLTPDKHQRYEPGDALARVRYGDGTLWDLVASEPGVLGAVLADVPETNEGEENGVPIEPCQWIATAERSRPER
jgi:molecular chaperone DnaK (HSP70)